MKKILITSIVASSILMASGYKIPEASTNAVALSAANIAYNQNNADAAYYNPANMVFMSNKNNIEADVMYLGIDATKFSGDVKTSRGNNLNSQSESFVVPSIHYVSAKLPESNVRFGLSIVSPGGLSKRWSEEPAKTSAEEFTLQLIEVNPSLAFEINPSLAFAIGIRMVHTSGIVKSDGTALVGVLPANPPTKVYSKLTRDLTGDSVDFGYNLALAYHPTDNLALAVTYRSKIDLTVDGSADLSSQTSNGAIPSATYSGNASVSVPLPATFSAAISYTLATKTTIEIVYEKAYWSAYKNLDFNYDGTITNPVLLGAFDASKDRNWKDTEAYRLGITQTFDNLTIMAGAVIDNTPVPSKTLGFELPGSNSKSVSLGARFKLNESMSMGVSGLYSTRESRTINSSDNNDNGIVGEFSDGNILILSAGVGYTF